MMTRVAEQFGSELAQPAIESIPNEGVPGTPLHEVVAVLDALTSADCMVWVAGGWGVDALLGRQTRTHRDLDLAVDARHMATVRQILEGRGYSLDTDWRPVRVELAAAGTGWVDLHPVVFDEAGHGHQADRDGGSFDYPADAFADGVLGGVRVPCLSSKQQIQFHTGYEPRSTDLHDLQLLRESARDD